MELSEFCEKISATLEGGDAASVKALENVAKEVHDPHFYSCLAWMFKPFDEEAVEAALAKRDGQLLKSATSELPSWLDNMGNHAKIKNLKTSDYYFKLAFQGFQKLATEISDPDAMSILSEMYAEGLGTEMDISQSTYWRDQCYIKKAGMTFDEWKKADS